MPTAATSVALGAVASRPKALDYLELTKPRLSSLVLVTVAVGYALGHPDQWNFFKLFACLFGVALVAASAGALNQYLERHLDILMKRTENRPLPSGRMSPIEVLGFGVFGCLAGLAILAFAVNLLCAFLAALCIANYVFIYTPLKTRSTFNTLVGAVTGALPPLMGWAAANGELGAEAWYLFGVLFIWQIPHFLAVAWLYREDYAAAGMKMLSVTDPGGRIVMKQIFLFTLTLIPVSLLPVGTGHAGSFYAVSAMILGLIFLAFGAHLAWDASMIRAKRLFYVSLLYLPLLFITRLFDLWMFK